MLTLLTSRLSRKPLLAGRRETTQALGISRARSTKLWAAFSLVEVTMAMGIISFGLVASLGLIPVGLNTMRHAMDATVEEQIVRKISGEVLLTPYSKLTSDMIGKTVYFDDQGITVTLPGQARFQATVIDATTAYPGSSAVPSGTRITDSLRMLQVRVAVTPNGGASVIATSSYRILVSNSGT